MRDLLRGEWLRRDFRPFRVIFEVSPGFKWSSSDLPSLYIGLVACEWIVGPGTTTGRVITLWRSKQHYLESQDEFSKEVDHAAPEFAGFLASVNKPHPSFMQRIPWASLIPWTLAICSGIVSYYSYEDALFSKPNVTFTQKPLTFRHSASEAPVAFSIVCRNDAPGGNAQTQITNVQLLDSTRHVVPRPNLRAPTSIPALAPGNDKVIDISDLDALPPGEYSLVIDYRTSSGYLQSAKSGTSIFAVESIGRPIEVRNQRLITPSADARRMEVKCVVRAGRDYANLLCTVTVASADATFSQYVDPPDPDKRFFASADAAQAMWSLGPVSAFKDREIKFYLETRAGRPPPDWKTIADTIDLQFTEKGK